MNFYFLSYYHDKDYDFFWADSDAVDAKYGEALKCPECGNPISMREWLSPKKIKLSNKNFPDWIQYYASFWLTVSERFKEAYEKSGLTGITEFNELEIVNVKGLKDKALYPTYYEAKTAYSRVCVDHKKSKIKGQKNDHYHCKLCNPIEILYDQIKKVELSTSNWEGYDIFLMYESGFMFVATQRFVDFCNENQFTNFNFVLSNELRKGTGKNDNY